MPTHKSSNRSAPPTLPAMIQIRLFDKPPLLLSGIVSPSADVESDAAAAAVAAAAVEPHWQRVLKEPAASHALKAGLAQRSW